MNVKSGSICIAASVFLVIASAFAVLFAAPPRQGIEQGKNNRSSGQTTRAFISVSAMTDAPLALQNAQPESTGADQNDPEVELIITNLSNKAVSAYALKYDVISNGKVRPGGVELTNISAARSLLQPGEARTANIRGVHYSFPIERIVVSIDFVEFADGVTWGADTHSSGQELAGMRAGARSASEHLLRLLSSQGPTAVAEEVERFAEGATVPSGHSTKWQEGFGRGMSLITERAKREIRAFSVADIERVLTLPIDGLDEIKRSKR